MSEPHDVEDRLRAALRARAESVEPVSRFDAVEHRVRAVRIRRRAVTAVAAGALVAATVTGAVLFAGGDDEPARVVTEPTTTTAVPTTSTVATTTTSEPDATVVGWPAIEWSFVSIEDAAIGFAELVLGYADPSVVAVDGLVVEVQPRPTSSIRTRIELADAGAAGGYVVVGATTDASGRIDPGGPVDAGPYVVTGEATAFEATLYVAFLDLHGNVLAETFTMAGSGPDLAPFQATLDYDPSAGPVFVLIGDGDASGEGRYSWAAVSLL